jgi:hypothetical protein
LTPMQIVSQADEERARLEKDIEVHPALRAFANGLRGCKLFFSQELLDKSDADDMDANAAALEDMYVARCSLAIAV